ATLEAWDDRRAPETIDLSADQRGRIENRPLGAMGIIGPFNFPVHLIQGHLAPALLAGNTVVIKPSELTPAAGATLVAAWEAAGLPPGVVNLVNGGREVGEAMVADPRLAGLAFTGSRRTGVALHEALAGRPEVLLALEMGGNNPLVAWPPLDAAAAAPSIAESAFATAGQRCTCTRRLIVPDDETGRSMIEAVVAAAQKLTVGPPEANPSPFMGPLITAEAAEATLNHQGRLETAGGELLLACDRVEGCAAALSPGIIDVTEVESVDDQEYFGPLLLVQRVADVQAAITAANATRYGLAAGLFSGDDVLWERFRRDVHAGVIHRNRPTTGASGRLPFGGVGESGNHRPAGWWSVDYCADPIAVVEAEPPTGEESGDG
ncbi:MAG: aldehyde dehydrogenase family protein, partial [Phycisphaeraceae bacterium]|nr:aldehyde dehydrogenase family protein [Phycisphaeraceae bacterium]